MKSYGEINLTRSLKESKLSTIIVLGMRLSLDLEIQTALC